MEKWLIFKMEQNPLSCDPIKCILEVNHLQIVLFSDKKNIACVSLPRSIEGILRDHGCSKCQRLKKIYFFLNNHTSDNAGSLCHVAFALLPLQIVGKPMKLISIKATTCAHKTSVATALQKRKNRCGTEPQSK